MLVPILGTRQTLVDPLPDPGSHKLLQPGINLFESGQL